MDQMADSGDDRLQRILAWHLQSLLNSFVPGVAFATVIVRLIGTDDEGKETVAAAMVGNDDPVEVLKMVTALEKDKDNTIWLDASGKPTRVM